MLPERLACLREAGKVLYEVCPQPSPATNFFFSLFFHPPRLFPTCAEPALTWDTHPAIPMPSRKSDCCRQRLCRWPGQPAGP